MTMGTPSSRRHVCGAVLALALAFGAVACGDDDDAGTTATEPTTASTAPSTADTVDTTGGGSGGDSVEDGCDLDLEIETAFNTAPFPESEEPTDAEFEAFRQYVETEIGPLLDRADALEIPEIADDIQTSIAPIREFIESGDPAVFDVEDPAGAEADIAISEYFFENCDGPKLDVTATDYAFSDVEASAEADPYRVRLVNDGAEIHEFAVVRKAEGVTETFDELLALPEAETEDKVIFAGIVEPIEAGVTDYGYIPIDEPGEYLAICFIPVGATSFDVLETLEGPPHFTEGMKVEFTVS